MELVEDQIEFIKIFNQDLKNETKKFLLKNPELSFEELIESLDSFLKEERKNLPEVIEMVSDFREHFDYIFLNLRISEYEKEVLRDFISELIYELK